MENANMLIGKTCYYPIEQETRIGNVRKKMVVAWIETKIVSVKMQYGRMDLLLKPKAGTGNFRAQRSSIKFELE